jgi:hypothetical protein
MKYFYHIGICFEGTQNIYHTMKQLDSKFNISHVINRLTSWQKGALSFTLGSGECCLSTLLATTVLVLGVVGSPGA